MNPELISSSGITAQVVHDDGGKVNPEMIELAKCAVACKGWRWMPGMLAWRPDCPPVRLTAIEDAGNALQENGWLPDLTDPATLGCLLALVREAWGQDTWVQYEDVWTCFVVLEDQLDHYCGTSEAKALVAALEAE